MRTNDDVMPVIERCPRCQGKGIVVKDGPHRDEYDSCYPCPRCTTDRTSLKGTGWVPVASERRDSDAR